MPGDGLDELALAVALDAGDAEDLAGAHLEVEAGDGGDAAVVVDREVADLRARRRPGAAGALSISKDDVAPDHERGQVCCVAAVGSARADDLARGAAP